MKGTGYLIQATLIAFWWFGLFVNDIFYSAFQYPGISELAFNSFLAPDLILIATLSVIRGYRPIKELEFVILGAFGFATMYCINASLLTHGGYLSTTLMILGFCYNFFLVFSSKLFKESSSSNVYFNGFKTIVQILCVWTITLIVFPALLLKAFGQNPQIQGAYTWLGFALFFGCSVLGLFSALVMVRHGEGTPLPIDQTQKLVIAGPYRYVRNPMAIAGLGQGIAVSILLSSHIVLLYTLLGAILWQFVVRPIEEKNMKERFGNAYLNYKSAVKCWVPTFRKA